MVVQHMMKLVDIEDDLKVHVRWRGLSDSEDTLEPLAQVYADVLSDLRMLLASRSTLSNFATSACNNLGI